MKNLNPKSGLKQLVSGYYCLPRKIILDEIRNNKLKPSELGYFIILLNSADWDEDEYRKGFIRHDLNKLANLWGIPNTTLYDNIKKLKAKKLLISERGAYRINNFNRFTLKGAQAYVKEKPSSEYLNQLPEISESHSELSELVQTNEAPPFNDSSKVEFNSYPKKVLIKQEVRSDEWYESIHQSEGYKYLTPEDMRWIDENLTEEVEINDQESDQQASPVDQDRGEFD